jgi:hypothetical protein
MAELGINKLFNKRAMYTIISMIAYCIFLAKVIVGAR